MIKSILFLIIFVTLAMVSRNLYPSLTGYFYEKDILADISLLEAGRPNGPFPSSSYEVPFSKIMFEDTNNSNLTYQCVSSFPSVPADMIIKVQRIDTNYFVKILDEVVFTIAEYMPFLKIDATPSSEKMTTSLFWYLQSNLHGFDISVQNNQIVLTKKTYCR